MKYTATEWSVELPESYTWMEMTQQAIGLKIDDEHVLCGCVWLINWNCFSFLSSAIR